MQLFRVHRLFSVHTFREVHTLREVHRSKEVHTLGWCTPQRGVASTSQSCTFQHKPIMRMFCIAALLRAGYCGLSIAN